MTKQISSQKLPSLDGWRAVSIVLVLLCHSTFTTGFPLAPNSRLFFYSEAVGIWGVRFFFVISGFLITHLLLREQSKNGFISLKKFFVRRAIRILPVCFFYLFVLGVFTEYSQKFSVWLANLTFTTDFIETRHPFPTGHLWSLGVEEQFYLLWPGLLVLILHRPQGIAQLLKILALPLIIAPTVRVLYYSHAYPSSLEFLFLDHSFLSKFDSLAYGCAAAVLFNHWRNPLETFYQKNSRSIFVAGVLLVFAPWILPFGGRFKAAGFESLQAVGFSLLLVQSLLQPAHGFYRWLNWKWVGQIGILSYSIYIWQQMFCGTGAMVFGSPDAWWVSFPFWIFTTLLAAAASYYLLEKPLLKWRAKLHTF